MSNRHKKPEPLLSVSGRTLCPVCGEVSYSVQGIHPQCAVVQADAIRMGKVKKTAKTTEDDSVVKPVHQLQRWQKKCPGCGCAVHVRKKTCDCGQKLL
jgi:predicted RNA-binding Zn-ribbon protein involved in translation (DUF1610 family)